MLGTDMGDIFLIKQIPLRRGREEKDHSLYSAFALSGIHGYGYRVGKLKGRKLCFCLGPYIMIFQMCLQQTDYLENERIPDARIAQGNLCWDSIFIYRYEVELISYEYVQVQGMYIFMNQPTGQLSRIGIKKPDL